MSKISRLVVTVTCDECKVSDENTQEFPVLNSKGKIVLVDLHPECHADVYGPGLELADSSAQVPDKAAKPKQAMKYEKAKGKRICLLCPETRDTDWGLRDHLKAHGLSGSLVEAYGTLCPFDGEPFERIGHHIRQEHKDLNLPHYSHAFLWAKENGDPHGVLAKQIASLKKVAKAA